MYDLADTGGHAMSDETPAPSQPSSGDFSKDLAIEIAKQLPVQTVYADGLSGPVRELGSIAENILKTVHLALFPIQVAAVVQQRFSRAMRRAAERVAPENRVEPAPQILGPVLEALKYEPEGTALDDMYSELLSRAFDKNRRDEAHAAYVTIIKQMRAAEALLLAFVREKRSLRDEDFRDGDVSDGVYTPNPLWLGTNIEGDRHAMVSHLVALGLLEFREIQIGPTLRYPRQLEDLVSAIENIGDEGSFREYEVSAFGLAFLAAVNRSDG